MIYIHGARNFLAYHRMIKRSSMVDVWIFSACRSYLLSVFLHPVLGPVALASMDGCQWASMPLTPAGLAKGGTSNWRVGGE